MFFLHTDPSDAADKVYEKMMEQARIERSLHPDWIIHKEAKIELSSHPDGVMHTTAMEHPEWFKGKDDQIIQTSNQSIFKCTSK